ncbi:MAG: hypothetical protein HZC36_10480 [Armatimonadetes bacterium]|nr:hypothetical protein [Armatimonadota bacterium]
MSTSSTAIAISPDSHRLERAGRSVRQFIEHLEESGAVLDYRVSSDVVPRVIERESVGIGHSVDFRSPKAGFPEAFKDRVEAYGRALSICKQLQMQVQWKEDSARAEFLLAGEPETDRKLGLRERIWLAMQPKAYRALLALGKTLVSKGFRVREPFAARLVMIERDYHGFAILLRYPQPQGEDEAGIQATYDRIVPLIADAFARQYKIKAETEREGDLTSIFFTTHKAYVSSLYGVRPQFRLVAKRPRVWTPLDFSLFKGSTYRACKKLVSKYKKDFIVARKPFETAGVLGHSVILQYKPGAGGKVVDDSYLLTLGRMAEKLKDDYRLQAAVRRSPEANSIVVTFYSGREPDWKSSKAYLS